MVYQTGGGGGESPTGGVRINMVPREGGNRFSGIVFGGVENWQSDNFGQELKNLGVTSVDKLGTYHDFDVDEGGPIKKDRIWFFGVGRLSHENKPVANTTNVTADPDGRPARTNAMRACAPHRVPHAAPLAVRPQRARRATAGRRSTAGLVASRCRCASKNKLSAVHGPHPQGSRRGDGGLQRRSAATRPFTGPRRTTRRTRRSGRPRSPTGCSSKAAGRANIERYDNVLSARHRAADYTPLWYQRWRAEHDATAASRWRRSAKAAPIRTVTTGRDQRPT